ncbi:MAG: cation transporter [Chloroflexi bacterium]|nr:cation transporter [Chloroflexota bacterium]
MEAPNVLGNKLRFALILTAAILLAELVGGFLANSLALLSDAGHVFTDVLALTLSWFGVRQADRAANHRMTYGYHRVGILIALINAVSLVFIASIILYEAYGRFREPEPVRSGLMFVVASVGFLANLVVVLQLKKDERRNLNVHSAFLHVAGDALASVGVILGGIIIFFTSWYVVDPLISLFIALLIAFGSWRIIKEGVNIVLEATPGHLDMKEMVEAMSLVPGVRNVHDLHVWSITPQLHALSCHLVIDDLYVSEGGGILQSVNQLLNQCYSIEHSTLQLECVECDPNDLYCTLCPEGREELGLPQR